MEYLDVNKKFLEIYDKDTKPTDNTYLNENSELVEIVESVLNENPELLSKDLDYFVEQINLLEDVYKKKLEDLGTEKNIIVDFNELINLIKSKKFHEISSFVKKNELDEELIEYVRKIFSICSIKIYIEENIDNISNKLISKLTIF